MNAFLSIIGKVVLSILSNIFSAKAEAEKKVIEENLINKTKQEESLKKFVKLSSEERNRLRKLSQENLSVDIICKQLKRKGHSEEEIFKYLKDYNYV